MPARGHHLPPRGEEGVKILLLIRQQKRRNAGTRRGGGVPEKKEVSRHCGGANRSFEGEEGNGKGKKENPFPSFAGRSRRKSSERPSP